MKAISLAIQKIRPMLKFLQTDRQTNRRTGQKLYAPYLSIRGHKKISNLIFNKCKAKICIVLLDVVGPLYYISDSADYTSLPQTNRIPLQRGSTLTRDLDETRSYYGSGMRSSWRCSGRFAGK
jgi:hypothetical protein